MPEPREVVLLHSPLVGPATWSSVGQWLADSGLAVRIGDPRELAPEPGALLVAHSNAGLYVPALVERVGSARVVYVDAALAGDADAVALAPESLLARLETLVGPDGRLPPWHRWWPEEVVAGLFPDAATRAAVEREVPRLPLAYFRGSLGVPEGWTSVPAAYLAFGETYAEETARARRLGWPVRVIDGDHLHQLHDPAGVGEAILALAAELG